MKRANNVHPIRGDIMQQGQPPTDRQLLDGFRDHQRLQRLSDRTIYAREKTLGRILTATGHSLLTLNEEALERYFIDHLDNFAPKTVHAYLSSCKSFYTWAIRKGHCNSDPSVAIPRPRLPQYLPRPIRPGDARRALDATTHEMHVWLLLMGFGGLRCGEVAGIRWEHLDVIDSEAGETWSLRVYGKGHKERAMPLHRFTVAAIAEHVRIRPKGHMFMRPNGDPWPPSALSSMVNREMRALEIPCTAHQWRHGFGTAYYRATKDLLATKEALGHVDPKTTAGYARADTTQMRTVVDTLRIAS